MSNFSQFFGSGGSLPFAKIEPAYLTGFVKKFPSGNTVIPVPGTSYYFKLPDANTTASPANATLVDNSTGTVLRTYTDAEFGSGGTSGYQALNAFFLDTSVSPANLYCFDSTSGPTVGSTGIVFRTHIFPANAAGATTTLTAAAGSVPLAISYAKRGYANNSDTGSKATNGAGFVYPDGLGNLILRAMGINGVGSSQITINMTTGAWTSQGASWFSAAPAGHSAYYTTANGLIACGGLIADSVSFLSNPAASYVNLYGGCVDQLVSGGFHVDTAEFSGPSSGFSMIRSSGVVPVLIGTKYIAYVSGQTLKWYINSNTSVNTCQTSVEPNLYLRSDVDALLSSINAYYQSRFGV